MDIIAVNQTAGDLPLTQLTAVDAKIPASSEVTLSDGCVPNSVFEVRANTELLAYVTSDDVLIKLDAVLLTKMQSLEWLHGGESGGLKNNFAASTAPGVGDDEADGYAVGSVWVDTVGEAVHTCVDASVGAAVWSSGGGGGADPNAIHDNVAAEISAIAEKVAPVAADILLMEDSADSNNKKKVQVGSFISSSEAFSIHYTNGTLLGISDLDWHDLVFPMGETEIVKTSGMIHSASSAEVEVVHAGLYVIHAYIPFESSTGLLEFNPRVDLQRDSGSGYATEIGMIRRTDYTRDGSGVKECIYTTIADVAAGDKFKARYRAFYGTGAEYVAPGSMFSIWRIGGPAGPAGADGSPGADGDITWQNAWVTATGYTTNQAVENGGTSYVCIQGHTSGATSEPGVGGSWTTYWDVMAEKGDTGPSGDDPYAIHDNEAAEISAIAEKVIPVAADILLVEDSEAANVKKKIQIGNLPGGGGGADWEYDSNDGTPFSTTSGSYVQADSFPLSLEAATYLILYSAEIWNNSQDGNAQTQIQIGATTMAELASNGAYGFTHGGYPGDYVTVSGVYQHVQGSPATVDVDFDLKQIGTGTAYLRRMRVTAVKKG